MNTTRRDFLIRSSQIFASVAAGLSSGVSVADEIKHANSFDTTDWTAIRSQFRLDPNVAHLSNFFLASNPKNVRDAIEFYRKKLDENPYSYLDDHMFQREEDKLWKKVAAAAATYIGGHANEIALTSSTTVGLALIYNGLSLKPNQEILTTTHDFYPHHEAIRLAVEKWGGHMRKVSLYDSSAKANDDEMVKRLIAEIRPNTRVLGITWVHSGNGVVLPIRKISDAVEKINRNRKDQDRVLIVVDGVHGFGVLDEDVASLGGDFFAAGTHKWILGPHGTGLIWAKPENWALITPTVPSLMAKEPSTAWRENRNPIGPTQASWVSPGGFFAYEYQWATVEAFEFHLKIGRTRIANRILDLNQNIKEGLVKLKNVELHSPLNRNLSAGIICFDVKGLKPADVVKQLRQKNVIASTTPYGLSLARLSAGIINSEADIDRALKAISTLS